MFNFLPEQSSTTKVIKITHTTKYHHYNFNNPMPLVFGKEVEPVLNAEAYKSIIETKLIKDLNNLPNKSLLDFLKDPKVLIFLAVVIFGIYYFASGGKLS